MAAVIGRTQGYTRNGPKAGEATRLGSEYVRSEANTWRTFARTTMYKNGACDIEIRRDGHPTVYVTIVSDESEPIMEVKMRQRGNDEVQVSSEANANV